MITNVSKMRNSTESTATENCTNSNLQGLKRHHSNISSASLFANRIVYGTVVLLLLVAPLGKFLIDEIKLDAYQTNASCILVRFEYL